MASHYRRTEIPKGMEHLFEPDIGRRKCYEFMGPDGEVREAELGECEVLRPFECPIDGCFLVQRRGDPHNYVECPCCGQYFSESGRGPVEYRESLAKTIQERERELREMKGLLAMAKNPEHPARIINRINLLYSKQKSSKN